METGQGRGDFSVWWLGGVDSEFIWLEEMRRTGRERLKRWTGGEAKTGYPNDLCSSVSRSLVVEYWQQSEEARKLQVPRPAIWF